MSKSNQQSNPESRRQQLRVAQEKAAKQERTRKGVIIGVVALIAVAIVGGVTWAVMSLNQQNQTAATVNTDYTVMVGSADAPVAVDIFQDFICPYCGEFERANGADIAALVDSGTAQVRIHPMNFLDEASQGTKYSTRAANALITVYKAEPDKALAFNSAMYENQPAENTTGLSDAEIATIATSVGVSSDVVATFTDLSNTSFADNSTQAAFADGITGTPTILINGTKFSGNILTAGPFRQAVEAAAAGK
ncbi:MAG TPA: thioredoxin domain-containing protein [Propionicimonas sp.]|nr:thioredoxin domain-containing protein [Propionicimonas sp.]